jgi:GxxExxY protein
MEVHRHLGPGLMESTYEICLMREFVLRGIDAKSQLPLPVSYKGIELDQGYKIDILVDNEFIIELKSVEAILPVHKAQLITYLKLLDKRVGFLVNFNVSLLKNGFYRIIQGYDE